MPWSGGRNYSPGRQVSEQDRTAVLRVFNKTLENGGAVVDAYVFAVNEYIRRHPGGTREYSSKIAAGIVLEARVPLLIGRDFM